VEREIPTRSCRITRGIRSDWRPTSRRGGGVARRRTRLHNTRSRREKSRENAKSFREDSPVFPAAQLRVNRAFSLVRPHPQAPRGVIGGLPDPGILSRKSHRHDQSAAFCITRRNVGSTWDCTTNQKSIPRRDRNGRREQGIEFVALPGFSAVTTNAFRAWSHPRHLSARLHFRKKPNKRPRRSYIPVL